MSNIQTFLENILSARFGKDVRQSIHDAIQEIDSVADTAQNSATESANAARKSAQTSALNAQEAEQFRNEAEQFRNEAESFAPEGYNDLKQQVNENTFKIDTVIEKADLGIKETASGEEIHLTDSAEGKAVEFALYGKAKQNTTIGKNLANCNGLTEIILGGVTFTPIYENGFLKYINVNGKANENTTYTCASAIALKSGQILNGCPSGGSTNSYYLRAIGTDYQDGVIDVGNGAILQKDKIYNVQIYIVSGYSANNLKFYPMISVEGGEYEPFTNGASPNPQYPQPIKVSGSSGSVAVKSCGKNLLDKEKLEVGLIDTNGNETANYAGKRSAFIKISENALTYSNDNAGDTNNTTFALYDENKNFIKRIISSPYPTVGSPFTFTFNTDGAKYLRYSVASRNIENSKIQLEYGEVATPFEPYKETLSTIPTENGLASVNDIRDVIVKYADGSGEYVQRVGSEKITSSDFTGINTSEYGNFSTCRRFKGKAYGKVVSNRFIGVSFDERTSKQNIYRCYMEENGYIVLRITKDNLYTTIEEFKNMIDESETVVYYELAEPIHTPLTAEEIAEIEKLHTFYPITNISNDFDCGMSVKYNCDSKNYIDNKIALLTTAMVNSI